MACAEGKKIHHLQRAESPGLGKADTAADGGVIVAKGQALFQVKPDAPSQAGGEEAARARREASTRELMQKL